MTTVDMNTFQLPCSSFMGRMGVVHAEDNSFAGVGGVPKSPRSKVITRRVLNAFIFHLKSESFLPRMHESGVTPLHILLSAAPISTSGIPNYPKWGSVKLQCSTAGMLLGSKSVHYMFHLELVSKRLRCSIIPPFPLLYTQREVSQLKSAKQTSNSSLTSDNQVAQSSAASPTKTSIPANAGSTTQNALGSGPKSNTTLVRSTESASDKKIQRCSIQHL